MAARGSPDFLKGDTPTGGRENRDEAVEQMARPVSSVGGELATIRAGLTATTNKKWVLK